MEVASKPIRVFRGETLPRPRVKFEWPVGFEYYDFEIGCGVGMHPMEYAQANPSRCLIAVEHTQNKFEKFKNSMEALPLSANNLFPVHANAISFAYYFVPEQSLDRVFLLYPNPYPKAKQANLRWHNHPFMGFLLSRLKKSGTLHFATNMKYYADEAHQVFQKIWNLNCIIDQKLTYGQKPRTHFEAKYLERGETCFDFVFQKK